MKICALETHSSDGTRTSAVDYWRVINPLKHTELDVTFNKKLIDDADTASVERSWKTLGKKYDILYSSYVDTLKPYAYLKAVQKEYGLIHIMDIDDNIYDIDEMSPVYLEYNEVSPRAYKAKVILNDAQYVTVTTPELRDVLLRHGRDKPIYVMPNYIDLDLWNIPERISRDDGKVNIIYQGSSTHYSDINQTGFLEACQMLHKKYEKKVKFYFMGMIPQDFKDKFPRGRVEYLGGQSDYYKFVDMWKKVSVKFDIAVAPLLHSSFNYAKSEIKYYEGSATRLPMVLSDTPNYKRVVKDGCGFLVSNNKDDWFNALDRLVKDESLRRKIGKNAHQHVKDNFTIQRHQYRWVNLINDVVKQELQ